MIKIVIPHLYAEFNQTSIEGVEDALNEVRDRWTWETGSEEDAAIIYKLEAELKYRRNRIEIGKKFANNWAVVEDENGETTFIVEESLVKDLAKQIKDEGNG